MLQNLLAQAEQNPDLTSDEAGGPVRPAVERCVARLAQESTVADADGLQEWLELNFVCRDRPIAMYTWRAVLDRAAAGPGGLYERVPPPAALTRTWQRLVAWSDEKGVAEVETNLRRLAPPLTDAERALGLTVPTDVARVGEIARNVRTAEVLHGLASLLTPQEREQVIRWAAEQAEHLDLPPDGLGGARYLDESRTYGQGPDPVRRQVPG